MIIFPKTNSRPTEPSCPSICSAKPLTANLACSAFSNVWSRRCCRFWARWFLIFKIGLGWKRQVKMLSEPMKIYQDVRLVANLAGEGRVVPGRKRANNPA